MLQGVIAQGHGSAQESRARNSLRTIEELKKELTKVENTAQPRAGGVAISVGVLNVGNADGTVFDEALIKFGDKVMHVDADRYTPVTAHGFTEVVFTTAREDSGQVVGTFTQGEESTIKAWSDLVKKGNEFPFEIIVTLSDKSGTIKGTVPKEQ
jgi:hypothetical protein